MLEEIDLQRLIDTSPATHYVANVSGDFGTIYISGGIQAQLGYAPEQFTQDPGFWLTRMHPEDQPRVAREVEALLRKDRHAYQYRFRHADGRWRWMLDEMVLIRDEHGNPARIVGSWLDITEREAAERTHRETAARLRESQRLAGIGSWEIDTVTGKLWWSEETYRIFGEDSASYVPSRETFFRRIHSDDRQRFIDAIQRAVVDREPYSLNYRVMRPDGVERIIWGRGQGVVKGDEPVTRFAGTVQDVTERARIEQALREAEARNRALLEANPDVVFRIDAEGRYLDLAVPSTAAFPFTNAELVGKSVHDLFGDDFAREHQRHVRKAIETGAVQLWECRLPLARGDVDLEARFVRSGANEAVVTVRDVTERLAMQREIVAAQERERRRIGHDLHDGLGQELTGISLGLEALVQKLAAEGSPHLRSLQQLKAITQKSVSVTRRIALSLSPAFGAKYGLPDALESLASEVSEHSNVECRAECGSTMHRHDIEIETNLYRIAQEGVTNALKHGKPRRIELRCSCDGRMVRLEVLDDGVGIPPEPRRNDGMGLRSIRYRTHLLNGTFECGTRAAGGTRIVCACPCVTDEAGGAGAYGAMQPRIDRDCGR